MPPQPPFSGRVAFEDLGRWNPWVERLTGGFRRPPRTADDLTREYDREKYAACLRFHETHPDATPEDIRIEEFGGDLEREICVSVGEDLYRAPLRDAWTYQDTQIIERLEPVLAECDTVCELGCGYGYFLGKLRERFPEKRYVGGDLSPNAVALAQRLYRGGIDVHPLNFYDAVWKLPLAPGERVCVFSFYALDNLPHCAAALDTLASMAGDMWRVCLFEPVYAWCSASPLGRLRREYTEANDYNRDLLDVLEQHPLWRIDHTEREYFGMNPLHPASSIRCVRTGRP